MGDLESVRDFGRFAGHSDGAFCRWDEFGLSRSYRPTVHRTTVELGTFWDIQYRSLPDQLVLLLLESAIC